ncbi:MAG: septum formation family protein [Nocardioides sp.]
MIRWAVATTLLFGCLAGCSAGGDAQAAPPEVGQCRYLQEQTLAELSNDAAVVACADPHTAQTMSVGSIPDSFTQRDDPALDRWLYQECNEQFEEWTGADASRAMRSVLTWAWWRPTGSAWSDGDRTYRCDLVGQTSPLTELPARTRGLLSLPETDEWMICARGANLDDQAVRVACSNPHDWRAVTTIKVGEPGDPYPGDRSVARLTRQYCSASVSAWLGYPVGYDLGYTWYGQNQWQAGNRRSVCWARTSE